MFSPCATPGCRRRPGASGMCDTCRPRPPLPGNLPPGAHPALSYRQLDYWSRSGYLRPVQAKPGSGTDRAWPEAEIRVANMMARLLTAGLELAVAARVARVASEADESGAGIVRLRGGVLLALDPQAEPERDYGAQPTSEEPRAATAPAARRRAPTRQSAPHRPRAREPQPEGA
jgi:DNA-binding transcriptional MerR regulator